MVNFEKRLSNNFFRDVRTVYKGGNFADLQLILFKFILVNCGFKYIYTYYVELYVGTDLAPPSCNTKLKSHCVNTFRSFDTIFSDNIYSFYAAEIRRFVRKTYNQSDISSHQIMHTLINVVESC